MHVLVTGATGFLGPALVRRLGERGDTVSILTRGPAGSGSLPAGVSAAHTWDPLAGPPPAAAFDGVDAVVHLAGEPVNGRWTRRKREAIRESRETGTRNLVLGIGSADPRPRQLVSASAIGYYGDRGDEILDEGSAPGGDFLAEVCVAWEREAAAAAEHGVTVARTRFGIILGPEGGALAPLRLAARLGVAGPMGSGKQWWSWVHRDDVVGALEHVLAGGLGGDFALVSPEPVRQRELVRSLARALHRPAVVPAPAFALRLALGGFAVELLSSRRVVPRRLQETGYEFRFATVAAALADLV